MSVRVLVTDGEQRSSLAVVRSLGRAGHRPFVVAGALQSLAAASRYAAGQAVVPSALADPEGFVTAVRGQVGRWQIDFILPLTEAAMLALLPVRDSLGAVLPCAPAESFRRISDKALLLETAREVGIAVPEQRVVAGGDSAGWADLAVAGIPAGAQAIALRGRGREAQRGACSRCRCSWKLRAGGFLLRPIHYWCSAGWSDRESGSSY